jgi:AbrB family looped-hinge helix DNA binding protein
MVTVKLTSKGQVTIPIEVRRKLRLKPGDRIDVIIEDGGGVRVMARKRPAHRLARYSGRCWTAPLEYRGDEKGCRRGGYR